jgi:hypothetical protein
MALREVIADLELKLERKAEKNNARILMERSNHRFVLLDGERICLSDAARKLNLSLSTIRKRIETRMGAIVDTIDLREIDIDKRHTTKRLLPGARG